MNENDREEAERLVFSLKKLRLFRVSAIWEVAELLERLAAEPEQSQENPIMHKAALRQIVSACRERANTDCPNTGPLPIETLEGAICELANANEWLAKKN